MQLLAHVAGVVSHTYVEPGEFAQRGTLVATLVSLDVVRVGVGVPGYEVNRICASVVAALSSPDRPASAPSRSIPPPALPRAGWFRAGASR